MTSRKNADPEGGGACFSKEHKAESDKEGVCIYKVIIEIAQSLTFCKLLPLGVM